MLTENPCDRNDALPVEWTRHDHAFLDAFLSALAGALFGDRPDARDGS